MNVQCLPRNSYTFVFLATVFIDLSFTFVGSVINAEKMCTIVTSNTFQMLRFQSQV